MDLGFQTRSVTNHMLINILIYAWIACISAIYYHTLYIYFSLNTIFSFLPKLRRTGLFSATQTKEVEDLIRAGLRNPVRISVKEKTGVNEEESVQKTPSTLKNYYMVIICMHV